MGTTALAPRAFPATGGPHMIGRERASAALSAT